MPSSRRQPYRTGSSPRQRTATFGFSRRHDTPRHRRARFAADMLMPLATHQLDGLPFRRPRLAHLRRRRATTISTMQLSLISGDRHDRRKSTIRPPGSRRFFSMTMPRTATPRAVRHAPAHVTATAAPLIHDEARCRLP